MSYSDKKYKKSTTNILLNGNILKAFPLGLRMKQRSPNINTFIPHQTLFKLFYGTIRQEKVNGIELERNKQIIIFHRNCDIPSQYTNPHKLLDLVIGFNNVID